MNWLAWLPDWIALPLGFCFGAPFDTPANLPLDDIGTIETFWWLLLLAMIAGLIGTYLGAWRDKPLIKGIGYGFAALLILGFVVTAHAPTFVTAPVGYVSPLEWYFQALGNFSLWLLLSLPTMLVAIVVKWRWSEEAGKIASSAFSEYLGFLCLCWMLFALALNKCT